MIIGVPKEIKTDEYRVGMLPVGAHLLSQDGHSVLIEAGAGLGSGFPDEKYLQAGAKIAKKPGEIFSKSEMIVKVKEPQPDEISHFKKNHIVFCYFHFAASRELTEGCLKSGITAVAYETLVDTNGQLPLLTPMSEVAGKMSIQQGAKCLERPMKGLGILLGGVTGVAPANVLVIGGGVVGINAAAVAAGMGANVTILDVNLDRLRYLDEIMPANVTTVYSDPHAIEYYAVRADMVVGAVLMPGDRAPVLINKALVKKMKSGSVIVDVCVDQGGCVETCKPTTHTNPTYLVDEVVHCCVANIPGAVSRTSSQALCNATLPYARKLARLGVDGFAGIDKGHASAVNIRDCKITHSAVSRVFPDL